MKRVSRLIAMSLTAAALSFGAEVTGTLTDVMCKDKDQAAHTTKCAIGCAKSGYGIITADGKFVKFDEAGNAKALAALKATEKEKDLQAKVTGTMEGDTMQVESIEIM